MPEHFPFGRVHLFRIDDEKPFPPGGGGVAAAARLQTGFRVTIAGTVNSPALTGAVQKKALLSVVVPTRLEDVPA
jgi:hypothetical protein